MTRGQTLHSPLIAYSQKNIKWGVALFVVACNDIDDDGNNDDNGDYENDGGNKEQQKIHKSGLAPFFFSIATYKEVLMTMLVTTTMPSPLFTKNKKAVAPPFCCKL